MPMDQLYWNAIDFGSEESLHEFHSKQYVDPWDLENYAYIREHLDSMDLGSNPSAGGSSSAEFAGSSGEFAEANSTSFYYVPGHKKAQVNNNNTLVDDRLQKYDSILTEQGNYVAIDEIKLHERNRLRNELRDNLGPARREDFESDEESPYEEGLLSYVSHKERYGKVLPPIKPPPSSRVPRDRSLSFSYGDYGYDVYSTKQDIYSKLNEEYPTRTDSTPPIYEDERRLGKKPDNFGLSNYGHLKIDYSYSWNNLNKYICN